MKTDPPRRVTIPGVQQEEEYRPIYQEAGMKRLIATGSALLLGAIGFVAATGARHADATFPGVSGRITFHRFLESEEQSRPGNLPDL